ncbi:nucleotidyltransferase domain-containing protein [Clostridium aquiflavi]|uniref:Nucleotidyltransferase domain-containing protein n=1 Tax=Clostridium aquiflavi TaxID=3073603 RepID=A0ABU1EHS4_9CLOT|nr:nucleotidyltransferase domain-containing protein [Clostridium sp. 5N-1]MDR5587900.1 nucleotidyltransferase domain-containing protein [Clostridium sp. 5N-1]
MDISTVSEIKDSVIQKIIYHIELFRFFENIYLFGSILNEKKNPNDIDLLLIYKDFSSSLLIDLEKIRTTFKQLYGFSFDLTVLSENEAEEVSFIIRLNSKYLKLK